MMLSGDELEALVLGSRWVSERGDPHLAEAARNALAKIRAVLPPELHAQSDDTGLMVGPGEMLATPGIDMAALRQAIRLERKLRIRYRDANGDVSARVLWPVALGYFDRVQVVVAWCELRAAFRHFRADRIESLERSPQRYARSRRTLVRQWQRLQGITPRQGDRRQGLIPRLCRLPVQALMGEHLTAADRN